MNSQPSSKSSEKDCDDIISSNVDKYRIGHDNAISDSLKGDKVMRIGNGDSLAPEKDCFTYENCDDDNLQARRMKELDLRYTNVEIGDQEGSVCVSHSPGGEDVNCDYKPRVAAAGNHDIGKSVRVSNREIKHKNVK